MSEKVLIVDDQAVMLRLMSHPLVQAGFDVPTAMNGRDALQKIQHEQPDLVILDVMLPDMNGIEVCRRIRQELGLVDLPIILLSGQTEVASKVEGLEAGADDYVTKPVDPKEMVARVRGLLSRTQRLRQRTPSGSQSNQASATKVVAVIGSKGGVGTTTLVANLSMALAMRSHRVIAVELRPYFGTLSGHFGLKPTGGLSGLLEMMPKNIKDAQVRSRLETVQNGLQVLVGPQSLQEYREVQSEQVDALIRAMTGLTDIVLLDLPHMPSVANRAALRAAHQVLFVVEPDDSGVKAASALVELLRGWTVPQGAMKLVVVNRTQAVQMTSASEIQRMTGCELFGTVTSAPDVAVAATKLGSPMVISAPDSLVAGTLVEIAGRVMNSLVGQPG